MNNKQLVIIVLAIIIGCSIIGAGIYFGLSNDVEEFNSTVVNNTTDNNETAEVNQTSQVDNSQSQSYDSSSISEADYSQSESSSNSQSDDDEDYYIYYEGEKIDTREPGQWQGATQEDADNYHPEL